jgi:predicted AlkP superfamily pyrophosphatase or phosphodiesterase
VRLICSLILTATLACAWQQQPRRDQHVVIISLDGFPAYALKDPSLPLPNLRKLAAAGAVADAMETVNPAVTWPNHTSVITGVRPSKHGVIYNGLPVRSDGGIPVRVEPWADKTQLVQATTLYDIAHGKGLTTGEIDWVAIYNAPTITYSVGEVPRPDAACVKEMIAAGAVTAGEIEEFRKMNIVFRDEIWNRAAEHMIEAHKPNLLLLHFLTTDSAQHQYGARSLGGNTALALADARVGRVVEAVRRAGIADKTTFFIVSDHGFHTYNQTIRAADRLPAELANDVFIVPEGGTAMVYLKAARRTELAPKVREIFSNSGNGIASVVGPEDYAKLGYPDPAKSERMADFVLTAAPGYSFSGKSAATTGGAHGYLSSESDMNAILIVSGAGVRSGVKLGKVPNLNVAPTAAKLLGLDMGAIEGTALTSALK